MDFRDFFRGFFGLNTNTRPRRPAPAPDECPTKDVDKNSGRNDIFGNNSNSRDGSGSGSGPGGIIPGSGQFDIDGSIRPDFVFGDMMSTMEEMFREMEQSMKDVELLFEDFGGQNYDGRIFDFGERPKLPCDDDNDGPGEFIPQLPPPPRDANLRDLVLKDEKEKGLSRSKIDKDLDDLFKSSKLNISEMPIPSKEPECGTLDIARNQVPGYHSTFERVYSTHSFINGKWEGKTIRETNDGKQITTYRRNDDGEQTETTEFIPNSNSNSWDKMEPGQSIQTWTPDEDQLQHQRSNAFEFFSRLFRPPRL